MTDLATAASAALLDEGPYVIVTGRSWDLAAPLVAAAALHIVAPGPSTRPLVAAGVELGGRRAVTVLDGSAEIPPTAGAVAFTEQRATARAAVAQGWTVLQPWLGIDLGALLAQSTDPVLVLLRPPDDDDEEPDAPAPRAVRHWHEGGLATLVASGRAVGPMLHLGRRLDARGVEIAMIEIAAVSSPAGAALLGGDAVFIGGPDAGGQLAGTGWAVDALHRVVLDGAEEADLVGEVLSHVRAPARPDRAP